MGTGERGARAMEAIWEKKLLSQRNSNCLSDDLCFELSGACVIETVLRLLGVGVGHPRPQTFSLLQQNEGLGNTACRNRRHQCVLLNPFAEDWKHPSLYQ